MAFVGSRDYWEGRYASGGESGAGSRRHLARYKADFINTLVQAHRFESALELGCGDGHQASLLRIPSYVGLDVSPSAILLCEKRFSDDPTRTFHIYQPMNRTQNTSLPRADVALSLDVVYHLVENEIYATYLSDLFGSADKCVVIYSSNHEHQRGRDEHVRHRRFTVDVNEWFPEWTLEIASPNPYSSRVLPYPLGSFSDFYVYTRTDSNASP